MDLTREEYRALEDVVGPEYISQDPAIRETYNQVWGNVYIFDQKWSPRPGAVILPGSTEDVQGIIRVCNRYGIMFKPIANGFEHVCLSVTSEHSVILDMRRMDRILEIDSKNMYAIIEPYVTSNQFQLEATKYGVRIGLIGGGPSAVPIQFCCSHQGESGTKLTTGTTGRQILGLEWVLPSGEIFRLGSADLGDGWFSAEGPGVDLRGVVRGRTGANGGNGVFTKLCMKVYPYYGPPGIKTVGSPPVCRRLPKVIDGYKVLIVTFDDLDKRYEATRELATSETPVCFSSVRCFSPEATARKQWEAKKARQASGEADIITMSIQITLGAHSDREMAFREKCVLAICEKWGGHLNTEMTNDPGKMAQAMGGTLFHWGPRLRGIDHFGEIVGVRDSWDYTNKITKGHYDYQLPYTERGIELGGAVGPNVIIEAGEGGSVGGVSIMNFNVDPYEGESLNSAKEMMADAMNPDGGLKELGFPLMYGGFNWEPYMHLHENVGPIYDNYDVWQRKIKQMLDPKNVDDWGAYIPPEYVKVEKRGLGERPIDSPDW